jgi:hypothetical protein
MMVPFIYSCRNKKYGDLYTAVDTPDERECWMYDVGVFVCKNVLGSSRVSQPLNILLCLF